MSGASPAPRSALNLRAVLAVFGAVVSLALAALVWSAGHRVTAGALALVAATAVVDLVVIARRRRREPGQHPDLFS